MSTIIAEKRRSAPLEVLRLASRTMYLVLLSSCSDGGRTNHVEIADADHYPCRFRVLSTGIVLRGDSAGTRPDPGDAVVRTREGAYLTTVAFGGAIAVWDANGRYQRSFGRPGRGPGEIETGSAEILLDAFDTIHVRDNAIAWSVFSADGSFARRMTASRIGYSYRHTHLLGDGTVLTTSVLSHGNGRPFRIADRDGNLIRSFGSLTGEARGPQAESIVPILSAYDGAASFWIVEPNAGDDQYALQHWDLAGARLQRIVRAPSWFKRLGRLPSGEVAPPPGVRMVHLDNNGLLVLYAVVPNRRWAARRSPAQAPDPSTVDVHVEVVDPTTKLVLVSEKINDLLTLPFRFFGNSSEGVRLIETPAGLVSMEVVRYELKPAEPTTRTPCQ